MTLKIKKRKVPDNPVDINNIISLFFRINVLYFQQMTEPGKKGGVMCFPFLWSIIDT